MRLAVFEWSGPRDHRILAPWSVIQTRADLQRFTQTLRQTTRAQMDQTTALGRAMSFGAAMLATQPKCWKRTLDISGDGKSNTGPNPQDIDDELFRNLTINALVIGADAADHGDDRQSEVSALSAYFSAYVIHGPDSFVEVALGFDDYEAAMVRKLMRELSTRAIAGHSGAAKSQ